MTTRKSHRIPLKGGNEVDAHSKWRRLGFLKTGPWVAYAKRTYRRRMRHVLKRELKEGDE